MKVNTHLQTLPNSIQLSFWLLRSDIQYPMTIGDDGALLSDISAGYLLSTTPLMSSSSCFVDSGGGDSRVLDPCIGEQIQHTTRNHFGTGRWDTCTCVRRSRCYWRYELFSTAKYELDNDDGIKIRRPFTFTAHHGVACAALLPDSSFTVRARCMLRWFHFFPLPCWPYQLSRAICKCVTR